MELTDRVVVITGGKRIGRCVATELAARGADVVVSYRGSKAEADLTVRDVQARGRRALAVRADVSRAAEVAELIEQAVNRFDRLDVLINMASVYRARSFDQLTEEEWDEDLAINLKAAYGAGRPVVRADRGQIHQALTNLVNNAIKFSPEGREVVVEVAPSERGFAQLIVRDSGPGIASEDLQRIFDRGYRAPGTTAEGSGLGLYITHQILSLHGCSIRASSPAGGGAVFRFTLPLAREGKPLDPPRNASRP